MATDQYSLRWNNYSKHISSTLDVLREDSQFVDVTLSCKGKKIKAHKIILSACSTYFRDLFKENPCPHPVIIFENVKFDNLRAVINFMYQGEVNIRQEQLASFMLTAELLAVEGLTGASADCLAETREDEESSMPPPEPETQLGKRQSQSPDASAGRKRRWTANSSSTNKRRPANSERDSNEHEQENTFSPQHTTENNDDRVEIIPIDSQVKVEIPEFLDHDALQEHYDSGQDQSIDMPTLLGHTMGSSDSTSDVMELYSGKTEDSNQLTGESMTPSEISQVLSKAGPSGESAPQDSIQGTSRTQRRGWGTTDDYNRCELCGRTFTNRTSLYKHRHLHQGKTWCPICLKVLSRTSHLKRHMVARHGRRKEFICSDCGKAFFAKASLTMHRHIHSNTAQCPICYIVPSRAYHLKRHMWRVHKIQS